MKSPNKNTEQTIREKLTQHEFNLGPELWQDMEHRLEQVQGSAKSDLERDSRKSVLYFLRKRGLLFLMAILLVSAGVVWWNANRQIISSESDALSQNQGTEVRDFETTRFNEASQVSEKQQQSQQQLQSQLQSQSQLSEIIEGQKNTINPTNTILYQSPPGCIKSEKL